MGDSSICDSVRIIQKGASEAKKDNESVVLHCIIHFESKPYPQAYRCEQGHTLCMIRGDIAMNVYSSGPPGPGLTHATELQRLAH